MEHLKLYKEYLAFIEAQRDDVKFAVHTSPDGEPTIMSKKQFCVWAAGYTGGYLRVYPYITMDDAMRDYGCTIATDESPKNMELKGKTQGTSGFKRFRPKNTLAYDERYHKWKIMEILEYSILSGYEVDSSIYYTGIDGLVYKKINVGEGVSIVISREDYERLWDEAFKNTHMTMDDFRKNKWTIATDDNGDEVILPYVIIPKAE